MVAVRTMVRKSVAETRKSSAEFLRIQLHRLNYSSRPIKTRFAADTFIEFAQKTADDVPATGSADFDVALAVDADDGLLDDSGGREVAVVKLVVGDDPLERGAGHFDE